MSGLNYFENIAVVSSDLQEVLNNVTICKSDTSAYYPKHERPSPESSDEEADEYSTAFFYHHRQALAAATTMLVSKYRAGLRSFWLISKPPKVTCSPRWTL
jgi:hypothetical protein